MTRRRLFLQLCDEIAYGYPVPWWPQDRAATKARTNGLTVAQGEALGRYIELVTEVAA